VLVLLKGPFLSSKQGEAIMLYMRGSLRQAYRSLSVWFAFPCPTRQSRYDARSLAGDGKKPYQAR
jgi:hypothetical protein